MEVILNNDEGKLNTHTWVVPRDRLRQGMLQTGKTGAEGAKRRSRTPLQQHHLYTSVSSETVHYGRFFSQGKVIYFTLRSNSALAAAMRASWTKTGHHSDGGPAPRPSSLSACRHLTASKRCSLEEALKDQLASTNRVKQVTGVFISTSRQRQLEKEAEILTQTNAQTSQSAQRERHHLQLSEYSAHWQGIPS